MGLLDGLKGMGQVMAGGMTGGYDASAIQRGWDDALGQLGLSVSRQAPQPPEGVKILQGGEDMSVTGTYNGIETNWRFISYSYMESNWSNQYTWVNDRKLMFAIPDVGDWSVMLQPRTKSMDGGVQTGNEEFDSAFHITTNDEGRFKSVFTSEILQDFADRGWMHLEIAGSQLTVIDDHANQFADKATGGMKMMGSTHPLFGYAVANPTPNMEITKRFLDVTTTLAKQVK